jgi:hypothetical protein
MRRIELVRGATRMSKILETIPFLDPARKQSVIYARVSSKEQEKEGFSIPAQLKLLREYAAAQGFIACGHCGCSIVAEIKKQRYIYYHCTGYKGRCDEPYVREQVLERLFSDLLGRLSFDDEALGWVREALHASHADETREHEGAIERLQTERRRLQNRLDAMYVDKLDGRVDATLYERMSTSWREEQTRCLR